MTKILLGLGLLVFIQTGALAMGSAPPPRLGTSQKVLAENFTLPDLAGNKITLSDFRGETVFLNFWATWCPPCREEMPSLQALFEKTQRGKIKMLTVALDRRGSSAVKPFVEHYKYTFPVLLDPGSKVSSRWGVISIPTTFIINKHGYIIAALYGSRDWTNKDLQDELIKISKN